MTKSKIARDIATNVIWSA